MTRTSFQAGELVLGAPGGYFFVGICPVIQPTPISQFGETHISGLP